jgi:hypothetical protein
MADTAPPAGLEAVASILQGADLAPADPPAGDPPADLPPVEDPPPVDPLADVDTSDLGVDPPGPAEGDNPTTLAEAAVKLGLTIEELYDLDVPLRDGAEPIKLGAMKDKIQEAEGLDDLRVELDDRRSTFENDMLRARQELARVVELLPTVPPALIEQAQKAHLDHTERERVALLTIKPEWRDASVFAIAKDAMLEVCAPYGFSRGDLDLVIDHRLTKLLHDFAQLRQRVDSASAKFKAVQTQQTRGGQKQTQSQQRAATRSRAKAEAQDGSRESQTLAVDAILRNQ